ncbi:hypothetical protein HY491_02630 [Candidatus Woesearchaeota archaeon]|nr:hypothetical protein [Candidatus Woesearchaeota archaeon]
MNDVLIPEPSASVPGLQEKQLGISSTVYIYANGQRIAKIVNNETFYFHNDHLGSATIITNETGQVVEEKRYDPFGVEMSGNSKIGYNSKELDKDTELNYYGARYYGAEFGRFVTPDTVKGSLVNPQSLNLYAYTLNNPLVYIDPEGMQVRLSGDIKRRLEEYGTDPNKLVRNSRFLSSTKGLIRTPVSKEERDILIGKDAVGQAFTPDSSIIRTKSFEEKALLVGTLIHEAVHLSSPLRINQDIMTEMQNRIYQSVSRLNVVSKIDYRGLLGIAEELRANRLTVYDAINLETNSIIKREDVENIISQQKTLNERRYGELEWNLKQIMIQSSFGRRGLSEEEKQSIRKVIIQTSFQ